MKFCLLLTVSVFLFLSSSAQWNQTNGPEGGLVRCMATDGTHLYAGTWEDGVYLSTDQGTTWQAVNNGITDRYILSITTIGTIDFSGWQ